MSTLEPGIYRATVRGVPDQVVMFDRSDTQPHVRSIDAVGGNYWHEVDSITDARPLIVLDLDDPAEFVTALVGTSSGNPADTDSDDMRLYALANMIREQTKPARIPEPGLHGVVEAKSPRWDQVPQWTRYTTGDGNREQWIATNGETAAWRNLIDPVLIRDGLS